MILKIVRRFIQVLVILLFFFILLFTTLQILTRYFRIAVFPWTEEVSRLLLVWAGFFSIALVMAEKDHINIDFIFRKLPAKLQIYNLLFVDLLFLFFCVISLVFGWKVAAVGWTDRNTALKYPRSLFYMPIPISAFFSFIFLVPDFFKSVRKLTKKKTGKENEGSHKSNSEEAS